MDKTYLVNLSPRPITIVLDHPTFRSKKYGWKQRLQPVIDMNPNTGDKTRRSVARSEPGSITVPGRGEVEVHAAIAGCAQVKTMAARRSPLLRVESRSAASKSATTRRRAPRRQSTPQASTTAALAAPATSSTEKAGG